MSTDWTDTLIPGPSGPLQIRHVLPSNATRVAVICHPHPQMGGTMDNKVVTTLARYFRDRHGSAPQAVVMFNYRGVGLSMGTYAQGIGELDDLRAVIDWAVHRQPGIAQIDLGGFSFGGGIAALGADRLSQWQTSKSLGDVVLAAPAVTHFDLSALSLPVETVVLVGEEDEVIAPDKMIEWATRLHLDVQLLERTGHFFHGKLSILTRLLKETLG